MLVVKCKELYRVPITIDLINEFYNLGQRVGKKDITVNEIYNIQDISDSIKITWLTQYYKEWHINVQEILEHIRKAANLANEVHTITYDLKTKELIVLDILKSEYNRICLENNYLVKVDIVNN